MLVEFRYGELKSAAGGGIKDAEGKKTERSELFRVRAGAFLNCGLQAREIFTQSGTRRTEAQAG